METLMKADAFFFVTTIAVALVAVALIVAIIYLIKILKNFKDTSDIIKDGAFEAKQNLEELCANVNSSSMFSFLFGKKTKKKSSGRSSKKTIRE